MDEECMPKYHEWSTVQLLNELEILVPKIRRRMEGTLGELGHEAQRIGMIAEELEGRGY